MTTKKILKVTMAISLLSLLTACGGGGGGSSSKKVENFSDMSGIWDLTSKENGLTDVAYASVDSSGKVTIYDYLKDAADQGADCYTIGTGTFQRNSNGFVDGDGKSFTASIENNVLVLTYSDHVERHARVSNLTLESLNSMSCENYGSNSLNTSAAIMGAKNLIVIVYNAPGSYCTSQELKNLIVLEANKENIHISNIIASVESNSVNCTTYSRTNDGSSCSENRELTGSIDTSCVIGADASASSKADNKSYSLKGIGGLFTK